MKANDVLIRGLLVVGSVLAPAARPEARGQQVIPHGQSTPPGEPLSVAEAVRRMKVPDGFRVEVVASEPDIVNPVAMTFDERGRVWVTESLEYPRREAGPGRDRVKVLEDTDGDGKADSFTVFADGLNIPSGIAVGHGGVWVANSPDLLFLQDTDGDGKADRREVVVTGFGRDDTHELPNSLTWGPDGWLYGWNGVFNRSRINYRGKTFDFTCAIFRVHPRSRDFEVFCEGTSNPWGIAWDTEGAAFASACVIDHLWHLTESGYYHRQGGPYPPHTWKLESIVDFKHQKAAYCGIHFYDSDVYPPAYREKLYMGNIHGNAVNVDSLSRNGATYRGRNEPDFLSANDAWFMPVSQKTGPDGSLYILDWYDRYHCYQDANRDPAGIDRLKGRLYRVRYGDTPRRATFDLSKEDDPTLVGRLGSGNGFDREIALRLLAERGPGEADALLQDLALSGSAPRKARMNALWALIGRGPLGAAFHQSVLAHADPGFRAWGVRAAGNQRKSAPELLAKISAMADDPSPDVRVQVAIASRKIDGADAVAILTRVAANSANDPLIPRIVWQNLHPLLDDPEALRAFVAAIEGAPIKESASLGGIIPRLVDRVIGNARKSAPDVLRLLSKLVRDGDPGAAADALRRTSARAQSGELGREDLDALRGLAAALREPPLSGSVESLGLTNDRDVLGASLNDGPSRKAVRGLLRSGTDDLKVQALNALASVNDPASIEAVEEWLTAPGSSDSLIGQALGAIGRVDDPRVAAVVIEALPRMAPAVRPKAVELLAQRTSWSLGLLDAIGQAKVDPTLLNLNQVRKLQGSRDPEVVKRVKAVYGTVRESRSPAREQVIASMRQSLPKAKGDPHAGALVFERVCGQCHKLHGKGQEVGPEITLNGRGSFEQLLSNVFDPSLVIGSAYQAITVATADGRVVTGLMVEEGPDRVVLKTQGAKLETIPRDQVDELKVSELSLMPEDLEKQIGPQELADLFAYITLDRPPTDPEARPIPGAEGLPRVKR